MIKGRVMAVDYGTKRIGIAMSDEMQMLASARGIVENGRPAIDEIVRRAVESKVVMVIVGLPKSLKNEDSEMTTEVRTFGEALRQKLEANGIRFEWRDERLTSVMANANIAISGMGKKRKAQKSLRDEEAARILLQNYLDEH